jgi:hypothetical protein
MKSYIKYCLVKFEFSNMLKPVLLHFAFCFLGYLRSSFCRSLHLYSESSDSPYEGWERDKVD